MSVRRWPGIGPAAEQKLRSYGIKTLGQLLKSGVPQSEPVRKVVFGETGNSLGRNRPAFREHDPDGLTMGSISNECTFAADVGDYQKIWDQLRGLCERVCWRMRQRCIQARTITLKLRYSDFETLTRARTIKPTDSERTVFDCVSKLLSEHYDNNRRLRLLGVCLSNLIESERQLQLPFDTELEDSSDVGQAIDEVRDRFGYDAIHFGKKSNSRWNR